MLALDAARSAGAEYAAARVAERWQRILGASAVPGAEGGDHSLGVAVHVLARGRWGFAATPDLARDTVVEAARQAVSAAKAADAPPTDLSGVTTYPDAEWRTPVRHDPFVGQGSDVTDRLLSATAAAMAIPGITRADARVACIRMRMTFASTMGSLIQQTLSRVIPTISVAADSLERTEDREALPAKSGGLEILDGVDLEAIARRLAQAVLDERSAPRLDAGAYDAILTPPALAGVLFATLGQATGADTAASFLSPAEAVVGRFRVGPDWLEVQCDRTQPGGLATVAWDDEGVAADSWPVVRDGVFVDYQTTRASAARLAQLTGNARSHGAAVAPSWDQPPRQGRANLVLLPGAPERSLEDMVADTDGGLLVSGAERVEIEDGGRRFRMVAPVARRVESGVIGAPVRIAAFEGSIPEWFDAMDSIGGPASYRLIGVGEASVGAPPVRVRGMTAR
jgi:TldD protein